MQQPTPPKAPVRRLGALAVAVAMVAGCTSGSQDDAASPPSTVELSPEASSSETSPAEIVSAAVGIGVDTQDFQLLLDIAEVDESGAAVSFFDDVLARADEGRGDPVELGDGLVYVPTDSIEGAIVDADGSVVPGASIGFGLLEIADGDAGLAALPGEWIGDATPDELAASRALVMFATTRRTDGATHIGFGDQFELDITFVDDVVPGEPVRQTTASGQAWRLANEDADADAADHDVFAARLAAGSAGLATMVDDRVVIPEFAVTESDALEGSTKTQKAIKAGLGGLTIGAGALAAGLVCLETVGLGCAAAVLFLAPRVKFAADQIRKGNDPSCPGTRFPGPSGPGGGRDTSPGGGGDGFMVQGVAFTAPMLDREPQGEPLGGPVADPVAAPIVLAAMVAQGDDGGGGGAGGGGAGGGGAGGASGGGSCPSPSAGGDIHLRTIDGSGYDLQSVGEFVAARSSGGHEIQLRTAPLRTSRRVSVGAAVAADVAGTVVSVRIRPDGVDVRIDGEGVDVARGDFLAVGDQGALVSTGEAFLVVWPDGSQLNVYVRASYIDIRFFPVDDDSLTWEGLFGDSDGDSSNDLRLADGTVLEDPTFDDVHGRFADSWRVTDDTSLFHYDDGEATATYTDLSFPEVRTTAGDLDPAELAAAQATCIAYGIVDELALADCAYDLTVTNDLVFLRSAGMLQDSTFEGPDDSVAIDGDVRTTSTVQDQTITGEIREAGDVERYEFEASTGDRVWISVDEVNGDCSGDPDEHLGWELLDPNGERVDAFGDIRGCPDRGPITLDVGGTWTLIVSAGPDDPSTGTYTLRLRGVEGDLDAQTSVGATVQGEIESVGVSDRYRFEADTGDRVWISVDDVNGDCSGDPDEHLGWELLSPDGERVDAFGDIRGCPDRGPITLDVGGTWTLIVSAGAHDPSTGTYTLRLIDEAS